jgi:hypothetical protein
MSAAGGYSHASPRQKSLAGSALPDTDHFMRLPRTTLSARPAHRASRGIEAVLLQFGKKTQQALRLWCVRRGGSRICGLSINLRSFAGCMND